MNHRNYDHHRHLHPTSYCSGAHNYEHESNYNARIIIDILFANDLNLIVCILVISL